MPEDLSRRSAELIMGWEASQSNIWYYAGGIRPVGLIVGGWNPLHDMNQCMMVVEMLAKEKLYLTLHSFDAEDSLIGYQAEFTKTEQNCKFNIVSYSINEAILIAALSAKEAK